MKKRRNKVNKHEAEWKNKTSRYKTETHTKKGWKREIKTKENEKIKQLNYKTETQTKKWWRKGNKNEVKGKYKTGKI